MKRFAFAIFFLLMLVPVMSFGATTAGIKPVGTTATVVSSPGSSQTNASRRSVVSPPRSGTIRMSPTAARGAASGKTAGAGATSDSRNAAAQPSESNAVAGPGQAFDTDAFYITLFSISGTFSFQMSAAGNFEVDWGDGSQFQAIARSGASLETYSHTYARSGNYIVKLTGKATGYSSDALTAAITFANSTNKDRMAAINGDLGAVFPMLRAPANGAFGTPRFTMTFKDCIRLTSIPSELFASLGGAPASNMFRDTFNGCTGLTGQIPADLFSGISGAPASGMFASTFAGCSKLSGAIPGYLFSGIKGAAAQDMFNSTFAGCGKLSGAIPSDLFSEISGAPASNMFQNTFANCGDLTGAIPGDLFSGIKGAPAESMFRGTFKGCVKLASIGDGLFDGISAGTPAGNMFRDTFNGCAGLTGPSATSGEWYLYEKWLSVGIGYVGGCYADAVNLSDYASIPASWK